jgi:hypothetical protein
MFQVTQSLGRSGPKKKNGLSWQHCLKLCIPAGLLVGWHHGVPGEGVEVGGVGVGVDGGQDGRNKGPGYQARPVKALQI